MRLQRTIEGDLNRLLVFQLDDGHLIESVHYRGNTLCVSSQVGCGVRCSFCASGKHGLIRNLTHEEIVGQVLIARERLPVKRIAVAGIGEPLANWSEVLKAFWHLKDMGLKVSFYTSGFPLKHLRELMNLPHNGVTVSIHTLSENKRKSIMPGSGSLSKLLDFLRTELRGMSRKKKKKLSLAYMMMKGVNDTPQEIEDFVRLCKDLGIGVTLLRYNDVGTHLPVGEEDYERAFLKLRSEGVKVTLSTRFRRDRIGGCGTLTIGRKV